MRHIVSDIFIILSFITSSDMNTEGSWKCEVFWNLHYYVTHFLRGKNGISQQENKV